ncbi:MAG: hypothetical protein WC538_00290 [Thermoanaerobaculia bacterium]|jgi:hypothetical protein
MKKGKLKLREPSAWKPREVTVVESYPIYASHWLPSRRRGINRWDIAELINHAARELAHGWEPTFALASSYRYLLGDCDSDEILRALDEYPGDRPEVVAVRAAFHAEGDVQCSACRIQHAFRTVHRCSPEALREANREEADTFRMLARSIARR